MKPLAVTALVLLAWIAWSLHQIARSSGSTYIDGGELFIDLEPGALHVPTPLKVRIED
jgi:hypothetical protein